MKNLKETTTTNGRFRLKMNAPVTCVAQKMNVQLDNSAKKQKI
jgi:hypothetical protein